MGMDICGKEPLNEMGEYLRYSVWCWHPLADYVLETAPQELTGKCKLWRTNDGDGLNAEDSRALAAFLTREIDAGRAERYVLLHVGSLEALPDEICYACRGKRTLRDGSICHVCRGSGKVRPSETYYHLDLESIVEFRDFLQVCGGFSIH